jgi:hypothetical protein
MVGPSTKLKNKPKGKAVRDARDKKVAECDVKEC